MAEAQKCVANHAECGIDENPETKKVKEVTFSDNRCAENGGDHGQVNQAKSNMATEQGSATQLKTEARKVQAGRSGAGQSGK